MCTNVPNHQMPPPLTLVSVRFFIPTLYPTTLVYHGGGRRTIPQEKHMTKPRATNHTTEIQTNISLTSTTTIILKVQVRSQGSLVRVGGGTAVGIVAPWAVVGPVLVLSVHPEKHKISKAVTVLRLRTNCRRTPLSKRVDLCVRGRGGGCFLGWRPLPPPYYVR